jgi:hypothetical protein
LGNRFEEIEREGLIHREIFLERDINAEVRAVGCAREEFDDFMIDEGAEELPAAFEVVLFVFR